MHKLGITLIVAILTIYPVGLVIAALHFGGYID